EQQRTEAVTGALGIGIAADHHLLPLLALDLDPFARTQPVAVRRVGALADRALELQRASLPEEFRSAAEHLGSVAQRTVRIELRQELLQHLLALDERD